MRMNTHMTIERPTVSDDWTDDSGQWEKVTEVFASVRPLRGREYVDTQQVSADTSHKLMFHYVEGIKEDMRAVDESGRVFQFNSIVNIDDRNRKLEVMATERG